jgi:hypothetical protein
VVLVLWVSSHGPGFYLAKSANVDQRFSEILSGLDAEVVCIVVFAMLTGELEYGVLPGC